MAPIYLNVAEKPSVALGLSQALGGPQAVKRQGRSRSNPVWEFRYQVGGGPVQMLVTSVIGHMMNLSFGVNTSQWRAYNPEGLFTAPLTKEVSKGMEQVRDNLVAEARVATHLVCWLDCDREGENISYEVIDVCLKVNPRLQVLRARFSSVTQSDLVRALATLGPPDKRSSDAVDARQMLDIRIGYAFTRFQTLLLGDRYTGLPDKVSYGGCQTPTLGFVVSRYWEREGFRPEGFWRINMAHQQSDLAPVQFKWEREREFDHGTAVILYEHCVANPQCTVSRVNPKRKSKWKPLPLATVELQKLASRHLRFSSEKTMRLAEELYQETLLSYPRTETDGFSLSNDELKTLIRVHTEGNHVQSGWYGAAATYAQTLLTVEGRPEDGGFCRPRKGRNDDKAHPPIHPLKSGEHLQGDKRALYELVLRHFLGCCSHDALADEVVVTVACGAEEFVTAGQTVIARNYLDIYIYDRFVSSTVPNYKEGDVFAPSSLTLDDGETTPPPLLTEANLIDTMDKNGIGTDATIASHIKTIKDRAYATFEGGVFTPTKLGLALVEAYDEMGHANLALPEMRAAMEADLVRIVRGEKTQEEVLNHHVQAYRAIFCEVREKADLLVAAVGNHGFAAAAANVEVLQTCLSRCGRCGDPDPSTTLSSSGSDVYLSCASCADLRLYLPPNSQFTRNSHVCPLCQFEVLNVHKDDKNPHTLCPWCYSHPPSNGDIENGAMRCFTCTHSACALSTGQKSPVCKCPSCGDTMDLKKWKNSGELYVGCRAYKTCSSKVELPPKVEATVLTEVCPAHNAHLLKLKFTRGAHPADWSVYWDENDEVSTCVFCDTRFDIRVRAPARAQQQSGRQQTSQRRAHAQIGASSSAAPSSGAQRQQHQPQQASFAPPAPQHHHHPVHQQAMPAQQPQQHQQAPPFQGAPPTCSCGVPCRQSTATTAANSGRPFFACVKGKSEGCDYFKWVDQYSPDQDAAMAAVPAASCNCGLPLTPRTVGSGANKGRPFRACPKPRDEGCGFFEWLDQQQQQPQQAPAPAGGQWQQQQQQQQQYHGHSQAPPSAAPGQAMCNCGLPAAERTATTASNRGRRLRGCPKPREQSCGFFEWVDPPPQQGGGGGGGAMPPTPEAGGGGMLRGGFVRASDFANR